MRSSGLKLVIVVLLTMTVGAADRAIHTHEACRFFRTYDALKNSGAGTTFWERVACSLILVKAT